MIRQIKIELDNNKAHNIFNPGQIVKLIHPTTKHQIDIKFISNSRIDGMPIFEMNYNKLTNSSLVSYEILNNKSTYSVKFITLLQNINHNIVEQNKNDIIDFIMEKLNIPKDQLNDPNTAKTIIRQLKLMEILRD